MGYMVGAISVCGRSHIISMKCTWRTHIRHMTAGQRDTTLYFVFEILVKSCISFFFYNICIAVAGM